MLQLGQFYQLNHQTKNFFWGILGAMFFYGVLMYYHVKRKLKMGFYENRWSLYFIASSLSYVFLYAIYIAIVAFIGLLAFFGFAQHQVFEGKPILAFIPFVKYRITGLSKALSQEMKQKLLHLMETEKPYLDNSLRLDDLSQKLNLSRNHSSQIINQNFNLIFFDFTNKYRVESAKQELLYLKGKKTNI